MLILAIVSNGIDDHRVNTWFVFSIFTCGGTRFRFHTLAVQVIAESFKMAENQTVQLRARRGFRRRPGLLRPVQPEAEEHKPEKRAAAITALDSTCLSSLRFVVLLNGTT